VLILVVVANILILPSLKAQVEKGSMPTSIGHGSADPEARGKPVSHANQGRRSPLGPTAIGPVRLPAGLREGG